MTSPNNSIAAAFNITPLMGKQSDAQLPSETGKVPNIIVNADDDYEFVRANLKELIGLAMQTAAEASLVASQSQQANAFTAAATVIKSVVDANKQLLDFSKARLDIDNNVMGDTNKSNVTNNLVITTKDLAKLLKGVNDGSDE